jgi:hypothetical protein
MGWQSRLPKDQKQEFKRTCNKCGDTGVCKNITDGVYRDPKTGFKTFNGNIQIVCKCGSTPEPAETVSSSSYK